ncbi:hypothetical protein [Salidesulfovibrio onnuriiensis]|uniref:hypothetical protein n=1 Tax=Salidesulfovibrio onnuriiensis TaxID=2583823 RepID=UPI0011CA61F8|nr:hypothetical protein [Salidesulfovibrio onnuriiensis]
MRAATLAAALWLGLFAALAAPASAEAREDFLTYLRERLDPLEINGFVETRVGMRTGRDPDQKAFSVAETRMQLELFTSTEKADFKYKGDLRLDGVRNQVGYETREAWVFSRPGDNVDIKLGTQVLTWGTGGLVFLNDLFPKDWQSFFIGRDAEYLKAPSTAAKVGLFSDLANLDLVYTPQFDPDRYINGEYISFWDPARQERRGNRDTLATDTPQTWFRDDEFAARLYRNVGSYEMALYGYRGFWKTPEGMTDEGKGTFPELNAYGASVRGPMGPGIGNLEFAYYHSPESRGGKNIAVRNSEIRYLAGYTQDLWTDFNAALQYYVEQKLDYDEYQAQTPAARQKDEFRHVLTLQLSQLLMNQNLTLALDAYLCPSDQDAYLRPSVQYKVSDRTTVGVGANIFLGEHRDTFFGQFEENSNIYTSVRYSF